MPEVIRGAQDGRGLRIGVVVSRFNEDVTDRLLRGALAALEAAGVEGDAVLVVSVPGAVEIPLAAQALARRPDVDAVVALGAVIKGETSHYEWVCKTANDGCLQVALETGIPVAFGVLTCLSEEQALARAGEGADNKGHESARVAVEMANLLREIGR